MFNPLPKKLTVSDDFDLRLRVNNQLKQVVKKILLYPAGPLLLETQLEEQKDEVKAIGYSKERIDAYINDEELQKGCKTRCYFHILFRNGVIS